jgi:hypothetical protein
MKVLVDPGIMPIDQMVALHGEARNEVWFITDKPALKAEYERKAAGCRVDSYPRLLGAEPPQADYCTLQADPLSVWWKLINDHQTYMLYDRTIRRPLSNSLKAANILDFSLRIQTYLEQCRPDIIVFMATPHDISRWLFARVAEELGVRVLYFQETLLPWRFALMEGLRRDATLLRPLKPVQVQLEAELTADFERRKRGSFADAFPIYERDRLIRNRGRFYNFFRDLRRSWRRPDLVLNKALCYRTYQALSHAPVEGERFVSFFLHFQPERTTLPESYGFGQQLGAIVALAAALPPNMYLYVKEHPSIYTADCQWDERLPSWYRRLAQISCVRLLPIETDPYSLIDSSECVATVAGTIGGEALIRGKPVIAFGRGAMSLVRTDALHKYTDPQALKAFLADIGTRRRTGFTLEQYCADIADETYSGTLGETCFEQIEPRQKTEDVRFAALAAAYGDLLGATTPIQQSRNEQTDRLK